MNWKTHLFSIMSGVLLFLSFPKFDFYYLIWISLIPLLYAIKGKNLSEAFLAGFITGIVYNTGIIYWITFVVVHYGYLPLSIGIFVMLLLSFYLSLYVALFALGVVFLKKRGIAEIVSAPLLWTILEYGKSHLLTGFPWENLAHSLHGQLSIIQIADITGIYGITFLIVFINCLFFDILTVKGRKIIVSEMLVGMILLGVTLGYGFYRVSDIQKAAQNTDPVNVSLVQGNIDQSVKWDPLYQSKTLDLYRKLSMEAAESKPHIIVWPETAAPFFFQDNNHKRKDVLDLAETTGSYLLFGSPSYERKDGRNYLKNSAYLVSPLQETLGQYDKVHLVPFGEYVPLREFLFFVDKLVAGAGDFMPGDEFRPLMVEGKKAGVLVCYEGIFSEIGRKYKNNGADLFVNITNDAWYGRTSAPYQHLSMIVFRAVENRVPIVRAANTGISAIIHPTGKVVAKTEIFERTVLNGNVRMFDSDIFYTRHGDLFVYICIVFMIAIFSVSLIRRVRK
jgi:apolipoprotein N-acyltransferase